MNSPTNPDIVVCPDGPVLVRACAPILDENGKEIGSGRRVIALCRCEKSQLAPLCDGTHKKIVKTRR